MPGHPKLYVDVDEAGAPTDGQFFLVAVAMTPGELRESIERQLLELAYPHSGTLHPGRLPCIMPPMTPPLAVARTRVVPPAPEPGLLPRERLWAALDAPVPVLAVVAAAGAGKTALLSQWVARRSEPTAWYAIAEGDDAFVAHLTETIAVALGGDTVAAARDILHAAPERWRAALDAVINTCVDRAGLCVILDDVQRLEDVDALAYLLRYAPAGLRVILSGRRLPPLREWSGWVARGRARSLPAEELRFTREELPDRYDASGGWPIAVQLQDAALLAAFVADEIWVDLAPEERSYLETGVPLDRWDGASTLSGLVHDGRPLPFLRAFLRDRAGPEIDRQAAATLIAQGRPLDAVPHLLIAGQRDEATGILQREIPALLAQGRAARALAHLDPLGDDLKPGLLVLRGHARRRQAAFEAALADYERAGDIPEALLGAASVYVDTVQPSRAVALLRRAWRQAAPDDGATRARVLDAMAENCVNQGRAGAALRFRRWARSLLAKPREGTLDARLMLRTGQLKAARAILEARLDVARHYGRTDGPEPEPQGPEARSGMQPPDGGSMIPCNLHLEVAWPRGGGTDTSGTPPGEVASRSEGEASAGNREMEVASQGGSPTDATPEAHRDDALVLAYVAALEGDAGGAEAAARQGLAHAAGAFAEAVAWMRLGHALQLKPGVPLEEIIACYARAQALADRTGVERVRAEALMGLALAYAAHGDVPRSYAHAGDGLAITRSAGDAWLSAWLRLAAGIASHQGRHPSAADLLREARADLEAVRDPFGSCVAALWGALCSGDDAQIQAAATRARNRGYGFLLERPTLFGPRSPVEAPQPATLLRIQCLGSFRAWRAGGEIGPRAWKREKARELFLILLTRRGSLQQKETLMELLWPDATEQAANRDFRVALHALSDATDPQRPKNALSRAVERRSAGYELLRDGVEVDADEFERLIGLGNRAEDPALWQRALDLYRGDYLEDHPYADWAVAERERLRRLYVETAERLARAAFERGDEETALAVAHGILQRDRCWEEAWRILMRIHARQQRPFMAARAYEECFEVLRDELGVEPSPETEALYATTIAGTQ